MDQKLRNKFTAVEEEVNLLVEYPRPKYDPGDILDVEITGVMPAAPGTAKLKCTSFLGGGFAGQVYQCRLNELSLEGNAQIPGLEAGKDYAVKIMIPASPLAAFFRNLIYWTAFQGPFSAQLNHDACRAGLVGQKLIRKAAEGVFGRETAVKDAYASFWDERLHAYGEITEWIEGRTWRLEADDSVLNRPDWRTADLAEIQAPEYPAVRRFMAQLTGLLHEMGAAEFARQYEWWTMKSQPNVMCRTDIAHTGPGSTLCAIDFRAGLALLPFLPMSPGDVKLILSGIFQRHTLVQFDRWDLELLQSYVTEHSEHFSETKPLLEELKTRDRAYRRSLPDIPHHGLKLLSNSQLRADVKNGLIEGYTAKQIIDKEYAEHLRKRVWAFRIFYLVGAMPILGRFLRKCRGNTAYRNHITSILGSTDYLVRTLRARTAHHLARWLENGRIGEERALRLLKHPLLFHLEQTTVRLLCPLPILHRIVMEPSFLLDRAKELLGFIYMFWKNTEFREKYFLTMLDQGQEEGMLTGDERTGIASRVKEPFIIKYLQCLAVHFATLPLTQIVSIIAGIILAAWLLSRGESWKVATGAFAATVAIFQVLPISPGSICRGTFVLFLMIRERNWRDYIIAAPVSFVKYLGYLAFPLQMATTYPKLAQFLAGRWAAKATRFIPVFGEKGGLLEHWVFDLCFNLPRAVIRWAKPKTGSLLFAWMIAGLILNLASFSHWNIELTSKVGINLILASVCVFVLPITVFYPALKGNK